MHLVGVDGGGRPFWVQQEFFSAASQHRHFTMCDFHDFGLT